MSLQSYSNSSTVSSAQSFFPGRDLPSFTPDQELPEVVSEIGKIHFRGNITPHTWYQHIKLPSGKPDLNAIIILGEIVYWYRPVQVFDQDGRPSLVKRFYDDTFQSAAAYYEKKFGLTKDQVRKALKRLEEAGFIEREYRNVVRNGICYNNVMFIRPVSYKIMEITLSQADFSEPDPSLFEPSQPEFESVAEQPAVEAVIEQPAVEAQPAMATATLSPESDTLSPESETYTKIPTILEETTTTTATSPEKPKQTQNNNDSNNSNHSCSSNNHELIFDEHLQNLSPEERNRICKTLADLDAEIAQQVLDEFNDAIGNNVIRKSKWAWLHSIVKRARNGTFTPTSELPERRRKRAQEAAKAAAQANRIQPERKASTVWKEHLEALKARVTQQEFIAYIWPIRAIEVGNRLLLEAPNSFVVDWIMAKLSLIEEILRPHTPLELQVRIG